jgi:hypothetical protein
MKQEDKELLLKDLCARLPYKVYVNYDSGKDKQYEGILDDILPSRGEAYVEYCLCDIDNIRPYLRPMSSMTEKEKEDMHNILSPEGTAIYENEGIATPCNHHGEWISYEFMARIVDWLNAHHFDYNGLIEKGLALEMPERMYNN